MGKVAGVWMNKAHDDITLKSDALKAAHEKFKHMKDEFRTALNLKGHLT